MLAWVMHNHPGELRADLQRFYHLNLDRMGTEYRPRHVAEIIPHFPPESSLVRAIKPGAAWDFKEHLLVAILDNWNLWLWANSRDGEKNRNRPRPIPRPGEKKQVALPVNELERLLALPRKAL